MPLTREEILSRSDRRYLDQGDWRLQSLTLSEWSAWESERFDLEKAKITKERMASMRQRLLVRCLVDAEGRRLFEDGEWNLLNGLDAGVMGDLYDAAMRHCGFDGDKRAEAGKE